MVRENWDKIYFDKKQFKGIIVNQKNYLEIIGEIKSSSENIKQINYWAADPTDRRYSYSGSGMPFHNQEQDVSKKASDFKKLFKNYFLNPSLVEMEDYFHQVKNISNKNVLDFGCGYGKDFDDLLLKDNKLTGIDISELYIKHCTKYCNEKFPNKKFEFFAMDAHDLKFKDETFDLIIGE